MKIIGNQLTANKFYIIDSKGNIQWVPNIEVAKKYASNPKNIEWYNKDIYATNENVVKDSDGIIKLASQVVKKALNIHTVKTELENFKQQTNSYINDILYKYAKKYDYDTIISMVSYKNSTVEQYRIDAEKAIEYRDEIYTYHYNFINDLESKIQNHTIETENFSTYYTEYLNNFPKANKEG